MMQVQCSGLAVAAAEPVIQCGLPARPAAAEPSGGGALSASHLTALPTGELLRLLEKLFGVVQPAQHDAFLPI